MIGTDSGHYRIVRQSLSGRRQPDEQTFASLAVLTERLEHLKKLGKVFESVRFSSDVEKLRRQNSVVAV
jgi:hypothetical protein